MPLDGTNYDEATRQLIDAKQLLIEKGWCVGQRENQRGEHCALGVLEAVTGEVSAKRTAVVRLGDAIPSDFYAAASGLVGETLYKIALYNNAQTSRLATSGAYPNPVVQRSNLTIKARRLDHPREAETIDLATFSVVEIRCGKNRFTVTVRERRLIISGDDPLTVYPCASNRIEIPVDSTQ